LLRLPFRLEAVADVFLCADLAALQKSGGQRYRSTGIRLDRSSIFPSLSLRKPLPINRAVDPFSKWT
jgi:hypothetical protein